MRGNNKKDVAAVIHHRLLNRARETGRPFYELLQYYSMERFLYRLSKSRHADKFILKGVLMLSVWTEPMLRPTRDIDFLGRVDRDLEAVIKMAREICSQKVKPDGIFMDPKTVRGEYIIEGADYEGVRIRFRGSLGPSQINMQLDISFGDVVIPSDYEIDYPTLLDSPRPRLRGYSRESAIAEKFQTMVKLGILNTRLKDFYDIWLLSRQFEFDGRTLSRAIRETFAQRGTEITAKPTAFTRAFTYDPDKQLQWRGFIRKARLVSVPLDLNKVVKDITNFLSPVTRALVKKREFEGIWEPKGHWISEEP